MAMRTAASAAEAAVDRLVNAGSDCRMMSAARAAKVPFGFSSASTAVRQPRYLATARVASGGCTLSNPLAVADGLSGLLLLAADQHDQPARPGLQFVHFRPQEGVEFGDPPRDRGDHW